MRTLVLLPIVLLATPPRRVPGQSADTLTLATVVTAPPLVRGGRVRATRGPRPRLGALTLSAAGAARAGRTRAVARRRRGTADP